METQQRKYNVSSISIPKKKVEEVVIEKKVTVNETLKSPICSFMGHVDAGKTSLMDVIRNTKVQEKEAGGITQSIGSSFVNIEDIVDITNVINGKFEVKPEIPGILIIDTPGHEAFNTLRERGSSLCDIAILVVDINDGVKPQTIESIKLLRDKRVPFVIAATKLDTIYNYKVTEEISLRKALKQQKKETINMIETSMYDIQYELEKEGIKSVFYFKNKNPQKVYSIVPVSSRTKEGIADLLALMIYISQNWMNKKITYQEEVDATIMESYQDSKHGWVLDIILKNGTINVGDKFIVCGRESSRTITVRKLLVKKNKLEDVKSVRASDGIRVIASNCDNCYSGTKLYPIDNNEKEVLQIANEEIDNYWKSFDLDQIGVCIQAKTFGELDALYQLVKKDGIPIMSVSLKKLGEKDFDRIKIKTDNIDDLEYNTLLYFGELDNFDKFDKVAKEKGIKLFNSEIVYGLIDEYKKYSKQCLEERQKKQIASGNAIYPCKLKIFKQHIYMKGGTNNLLFGVKVLEGKLRIGSPLYVVKKERFEKDKIYNMKTEKEYGLGIVTSLQKNNEDIELANQGDEVCIRLDNVNELIFSRHFDHKDTIISHLSRESIDILKKDYRDNMTKQDWMLVVEFMKILNIKKAS